MTERKGSGGPAAAAVKAAGAAPISPARSAAFELLERIGATSAHSDDLLHGPRLAKLSQADKDLTTTLVLGVLRWQIALDARLRPLLSRPDMQIAEPVAIALRLGAFQLLHLERIPAHAALNESVELVRAAGHAHAAGMVNAVLRNLTRTPAARKPLVEPVAAMAERLGHPGWLVQRWTKHYGRKAAEAICLFDQEQPGCEAIFAAAGADGATAPVMDAGSRLVAELAAAARPEAGRVWDCCAAPGGKTVVLGERLPGAELLATDTNPKRSQRLEQRLGRDLGERSFTVETADAATMPVEAGSFDLILCDVPCSGTGTLSRNPEIRHRLEALELRRQAERQERILRGALRRLAPGGRLVYSTCSLEPEENEAVVESVLRDVDGPEGLRLLPIRQLLDGLRDSGRVHLEPERVQQIIRGDYLRTLPGYGFAGDGFFAAVLARAD